MSNFKSWFKSLFFNFSRVFQRYQAGCFFSALLTFAILVIIWTDWTDTMDSVSIWGSIAWGSGIATCLAFTFEFACITRGFKLWHRIVGTAVITLVAVGSGVFFYFQLEHPDHHHIYVDCVTIFVTMLCMLLPFTGNRSANRVWNYHDTLVGCVAIAGVLCGVILLCLYAIMGTIILLFDVSPVKIMASLPAIIGIFLFTCTAATLIPTELDHYDEMPNHPRFTRILSQYILLPLICVEGIVLYVYGLSILIHWELPKGGIVWLVFSYAIIGSLIWYMLIPAFLSEEKHWIKFFHRGFFLSLLPLLILLFVGLFRRISDYGLTTNRYIVFVISAWFAVISMIFSIKKLKNVTPLILSLIIISIMTLVGPWSMFAVPKMMNGTHFDEMNNEYVNEADIEMETDLIQTFCKTSPDVVNISDYDYAFNSHLYRADDNETFNMGGNKIKVYNTVSDTCPLLHFKVNSHHIAINVADSLNLQVTTDNHESSCYDKTMSRHIIRHSDEDVELLLDFERVDIKFQSKDKFHTLDVIDFSGYVRFRGN